VSLEDNLMRLFGSERIAKIMDRLGLEEGEVIQHSMISKSIERAQKKVEENNFAQRKRLLEYDDVMNSQRDVIYTRRKNALFGDRLDVDILNMIYDTSEDLVVNAKAAPDYDSFKLNTLSVLSMDVKISKEEFDTTAENELSAKLYEAVLAHYNEKNEKVGKGSLPILKNIHKERGATVKDIMIPFSDGKKQVGVVANLEKCIETEGKEVTKSMEKMIALATIDQSWKEHLREMDDLKQSVQNAVYEQKDPLLIYKFESFELFKQFIAKVNEETISFLIKAEIPVQEPDEVQEARNQRSKQNYKESKEESRSALSSNAGNRPPVERATPVKSEKVYGRNDRVSVQYSDGTTKKDVKFKSVEEDVKNNNCVVIE
jgi:preprotein translocase subunit SecA